jgi:hypothetical protein
MLFGIMQRFQDDDAISQMKVRRMVSIGAMHF